jgi:succinate dehydrogenase / fumarate reductase flavoprotein subunit
MTSAVPQHILDSLTDVPMPRLPAPEPAHAMLAGLPTWRCDALVVGSGAAGLRAAVELRRRGVAVAVISQSAWGGTSACSGSDKQTLHTANTSLGGDDFRAMARALAAGGAMDADTAYVEAVGSVRAMASLQYLGLPLPQDPLGGTLRYQTDHDETGRATSCGPRTSRLMVKVLADEALRLGIPLHNHTTAARILVRDGRAAGLVAFRQAARTADDPLGLVLFRCGALVLAAGGPGELYRDSVYPNGCFGALGLALEAGITAVNLTESQFGIGTRREGFPWNLSGTYVQAIPHICSVDASGTEHAFLAGYYRTTQEMASNIFRKGYQWPFHATRMLDHGSSLVDLAIWRETAAGRRVFMDFNRNPLPVAGDAPFSLDRLDPDVASYLGTAGATQSLPIERLRHMNPLAIELYRRAKIDIAARPLEFAVNNQHMNGGLAVDSWGATSLPGCYAVGEAAGTHGVTRPGGAALNAGQVLATRAAEHIAATLAPRASGADAPSPARSGALSKAPPSPLGGEGWGEGNPPPVLASDETRSIAAASGRIRSVVNPDSPLSLRAVRDAVQARMSDHAGLFCRAADVARALAEARALNARIRTHGIRPARPAEAPRALQWQQMALASEAVLTALDAYIRAGGGSRGARAICAADGTSVPVTADGHLEDFRFRPEDPAHRAEQIAVTLEGDRFRLETRPVRSFDDTARPFFERDWPAWLTGRIYTGG